MQRSDFVTFLAHWTETFMLSIEQVLNRYASLGFSARDRPSDE